MSMFSELSITGFKEPNASECIRIFIRISPNDFISSMTDFRLSASVALILLNFTFTLFDFNLTAIC